MRALAIVDGEHYAPVVRDALAELPYDFVGAVLVGGREKLRGREDYGVPLDSDIDAAIARHTPEVVVDLSDEPVLGPVARFALAAIRVWEGNFGAAFDELLEVVLRDKADWREKARKQLVEWFEVCADPGQVSRGRRYLGMYLN